MTTSWGLERSLAAEDDDIEGLLLAGERALLVEGDLRASRRWFDAAHREAERRSDGPAMGRAALGLGGLWAHEHRGAVQPAVIRVRQQDALRRIDPRSVLALRLRIRLAGEEDYRTGGHTTILALADEARGAGDPIALAEALSLAHLCVRGPEHGPLRLKLAQELIDEASRTGRRSDLLIGLLWQTLDLFLTADPHAQRCLEELRELLASEDHLAVGYVFSVIEVMLAIRAGQFDRAEAMSADCAERGAAAGDVNTTGWRAGHLGVIRWFQGRADELVPLLSEVVDSSTISVVDYSSVAGLALAAATAGDKRLAASALARLCGRDLAGLPRSSSWLMTLYCVVEAAYLLEDAETAAHAYALLSPFAHLPVVAGLGVTCLGSVHHSLGVASLTVGDMDMAEQHLHQAVRGNLALGHWPAVVLSRSRLGQVLAMRDGHNNEAARRELTLAAQEAAGLGMKLPIAPADPPAITTGEAGSPAGRAARCLRHGRRWRIELSGRATLTEDSVGMRYLAILLANPGAEIPAVDLAAGSAVPGMGLAGSGTALEGSDTALAGEFAQPMLDGQAKREYKRRLSRLQAEIDELESAGDFERAAAVGSERDWLIAELAATAGLGGRTRQFANGHERARIAVGKAIRRALDRITAADPAIGAELRTTIQTGRRCSYRPT